MAVIPSALSTTWASLAILGGRVTDVGDHLTIDADIPGHRWAHALSVQNAARVDDARHWLDLARAAFPGIIYPAVGLPAAPDPRRWAQVPCPRFEGVEVEWYPHRWLALSAREVRTTAPLPQGYSIELIESETHWRRFADLPSPGGRDYRRVLTERLRRAHEAGRSATFGAFCGDRLVADGSVLLCPVGDELCGRFADIHTHSDHRGQGLARHLLRRGHEWAARGGAASSVVVADVENEAVSLYRHLGYRDADTAWMVLPRRIHLRPDA